MKKHQAGLWHTFRIPVILLACLGIAWFAVTRLAPLWRSHGQEDSPVTALEAENSKTYRSLEEAVPEDFTCWLIRENGEREQISQDQVELDMEGCIPVGEQTTVTLKCQQGGQLLTCTCAISVARDAVVSIQCGYPQVSQVTATLYSNGELCFEGSGDVMLFAEGDAPWLGLDTDVPIRSVSFSEGVAPTNMNYWFERLDSLCYVCPIPTSVLTMIRTFSGCTALTSAPDWTRAECLLDITECFRGCTALEETSPLPARVRVAGYAYADCTRLTVTPDMTGAGCLEDASGMFSGCENLVEGSMCPAGVNLERMFAGCINLRCAPALPETAQILTETFSGCLSLTRAGTIPASARDMDGMFRSCELLDGVVTILAQGEDLRYSGMFSGAALATGVSLRGDCPALAQMADTCTSGNVTVSDRDLGWIKTPGESGAEEA